MRQFLTINRGEGRGHLTNHEQLPPPQKILMKSLDIAPIDRYRPPLSIGTINGINRAIFDEISTLFRQMTQLERGLDCHQRAAKINNLATVLKHSARRSILMQQKR